MKGYIMSFENDIKSGYIQVSHNKDTFDYIISAEDGEVVVTKYLNEKEWNEHFQCEFTKTEEIARSSNPTFLSYTYEAMENDGIVGTIYTSSSMDYATDCGFEKNGDARDIWDRAEDIYRTRQFNENY